MKFLLERLLLFYFQTPWIMHWIFSDMQYYSSQLSCFLCPDKNIHMPIWPEQLHVFFYRLENKPDLFKFLVEILRIKYVVKHTESTLALSNFFKFIVWSSYNFLTRHFIIDISEETISFLPCPSRGLCCS